MTSGTRAAGRAPALLALALAVATALVYAPVAGFEFVTYDDPEYVTDNPWVRSGLTLEGLRRAFLSFHSSNWHPLTWLAHMLDVELFGLDAGAHHLVNAALHATTAGLLLLVLNGATGRLGASAFVAALFALHPLRVESVAWVSERKDVLSGLLFVLLLLAYGRYARAPRRGRYLLVVVLLALGLLAKPMLVTAPLVLLVVDRWPLRRTEPLGARVREKLPLLALSAGSVVLTVLAQRAGGALRSVEAFPLDARLSNAIVGTATYLAKTVWPTNLAYFHPHPALDPAGASPWGAPFLASLLLLLAASLVAWRLRRAQPWLAAGWLAYLVLLAPVVGLVQVGEQAWAERYAYLPLLGPYVAGAFAVDALLRRRPALRPAALALGGLALVACAGWTRVHLSTWRDSRSLYEHALRVTERNHAAHVGLANVLREAGDLDGARRHYQAALALRPDHALALFGLGLLYQEAGEPQRALELYRRAVERQPGLAPAHLNLGSLHAAHGALEDARRAFERVLELVPEQPDALLDLGVLYLSAGEAPVAVGYLERARRARPDDLAVREQLAAAYATLERHVEAVTELRFVVARAEEVGAPLARFHAWLLATCPDVEASAEEARRWARFAVEASGGGDSGALEALAAALARAGDLAGATRRQEAALRAAGDDATDDMRARLEGYRAGRPFLHEHGAP